MFALIDCNNFYASCERVFNPKLSGKAICVLSNNDGCVIARSNEAKKLGIKMGQPAFQLKELVRTDQVVLLSSNFTLYGDMSDRVMQTLREFGFEMEIYSIDEAFLQLPFPKKDVQKVAGEIRTRILKWTGIPVSLGVAHTKTLAKLASRIAKKGSGTFILTDNTNEILAKTPLTDIWGIGKRCALRLSKSSVLTAKAFSEKEDLWIRKKLGVTGLKTALELRGTPSFSLEDAPKPKKSILCSRSFRDPIVDKKTLEERLSKYTANALEKLRKQKMHAASISIFIATSPFEEKSYYANSCTITLPLPSNYTPQFLDLMKRGLTRIFKEGIKYKRAGVILADFSSVDELQTDLFSSEKENPRKKEAMRALDKINAKYDKEALFFAAEGLSKNFRKSHSSPKYTTSWNDLIHVQSKLP